MQLHVQQSVPKRLKKTLSVHPCVPVMQPEAVPAPTCHYLLTHLCLHLFVFIKNTPAGRRCFLITCPPARLCALIVWVWLHSVALHARSLTHLSPAELCCRVRGFIRSLSLFLALANLSSLVSPLVTGQTKVLLRNKATDDQCNHTHRL